MQGKADQETEELVRAEDIFLGAMGLAEDACLELIVQKNDKVILCGKFKSDNQKFEVEYDLELTDLEKWALDVLKKNGKLAAD